MFQFEHLLDICYETLFFCFCWSSNRVHSEWILGFLFVFGGFTPKRVALESLLLCVKISSFRC
jgi:hypothetical protein